MNKAPNIRLLRNSRVLWLLCSPLLLAGCAHENPTAMRQPFVPAASRSVVQSSSVTVKPEPCVLRTLVVMNDKSKDDLPISTPPKTNSLTVQLGDALLDVFKTFTDRQ